MLDYLWYNPPLLTDMQKLHAFECGIETSEVHPPYPNTVLRILEKTGIPVQSVQDAPSVDILREKKANPKYLGDFIDKLDDIHREYKINLKNM